MRIALGSFLSMLCIGCAAAPLPADAWQSRLRGDTVLILGEVHDNAEQHRLRLEVLHRAFAEGWRPAIAMEQFDRDRQDGIEQARLERPGNAQHVIDRAATPVTVARTGWNWDFYRPFVELALHYDVPLVAANLSNADTSRIVKDGYTAVFDAPTLAALGLDRPIAAAWQAAQEQEINAGHCRALPASVWPRMARAQFARDAVMARLLLEHADRGVVLLAGNGHARRDLGVPRWLAIAPRRLVSIGFLEDGDEEPDAFDAVVRTVRAARDDPCAAFRRR